MQIGSSIVVQIPDLSITVQRAASMAVEVDICAAKVPS